MLLSRFSGIDVTGGAAAAVVMVLGFFIKASADKGGDLPLEIEAAALVSEPGDVGKECFWAFPEPLTTTLLTTPFAGDFVAGGLAVVSEVFVADDVASFFAVTEAMLVPVAMDEELVVTPTATSRTGGGTAAVAVALVGSAGARLLSNTVLRPFGALAAADNSGIDAAASFGGVAGAAAALPLLLSAFFAVLDSFHEPLRGRCGCGR